MNSSDTEQTLQSKVSGVNKRIAAVKSMIEIALEEIAAPALDDLQGICSGTPGLDEKQCSLLLKHAGDEFAEGVQGIQDGLKKLSDAAQSGASAVLKEAQEREQEAVTQ